MESEIIRYRVLGTFPCQWEDILPVDDVEGRPSFTLMTTANYGSGEGGDEPGYDPENRFWNIVVEEEEIRKADAIAIIAAHLEVPPDHVVIDEEGFAQST